MEILLMVLTILFGYKSVWAELPPAHGVVPYITGGAPAAKGQFPWQVAIDVNTTTHRKFCGGSIIDEYWVLTSAVCILGAQSAQISAGITNIQDLSDAQIRSGVRFIPHEDYVERQILHDIGLIRVNIRFDVKHLRIAVIALGTEEVAGDQLVIASGWGSNETNSTIGDPYLNYVSLKTISNNECKQFYSDVIADEILCAVSRIDDDKPRGICVNDSGGPLVVNASTSPLLVAISTFFSANGCAYGDPSGFTRTAPYRHWIQAVINW